MAAICMVVSHFTPSFSVLCTVTGSLRMHVRMCVCVWEALSFPLLPHSHQGHGPQTFTGKQSQGASYHTHTSLSRLLA